MSTIPQLSEAMKWVLEEYPRQIERETHFVERRSAQLTGSVFVQGMVFAWMNQPDASYNQLRDAVATQGVAVTKQAIEQRFSPESVELFQAVLNEAGRQLICSDEAVAELLSRFAGVYVQDGSIVSLPEGLAQKYPGCGGKTIEAGVSSLRIQVRWDLARGGMQGPWLQAGRTAERSGEAIEVPMPKGSLFIGDANYLSLQAMRQRDKDGHYWMTPPKPQTGFYDAQGVKWTFETFLQAHEREPSIDVWIELGLKERLPVRLVGKRVKPEVAAKRRERARVGTCKPGHRKGMHRCGPSRAGRKPFAAPKDHRKQKRQSRSAFRLADWSLVLTTVPVSILSVNEVLVLMRMRWQEELIWKMWKQEGKIDSWRSEKLVRIETEIYGKLIGLFIAHWITLLGCWQDPRRSLRQARQMVQWAAPALSFAMAGQTSLSVVLARTTAGMRQGCRIDSRCKKHNTYQLLADPNLIRS